MIRTILLLALWCAVPLRAGANSSTSWTCEQQDFHAFVRDRFFRCVTRAGMRTGTPKGFPFKADRDAMAVGLIEGQQRFFPHQPDVKLRLLAFSMCETQGNSIDVDTRWGREVGWTGWNIHVLRGGAAFGGIAFPASDARAIARIKRDHRWAGYLTMAACAAFTYDMGGFEHALAVKTFGFRGWGREYREQGKNVRTWMKQYQKWLAVTEVAYEWDGVSPISARLYAAAESATPMTPVDPRK